MKATGYQAMRRRTLLLLILIGTAAGSSYPVLSGEYHDPRALLNGMFIGLTGSIIIFFFEFKLFKPQNRRFPFMVIFISKTLLYFSAFIIIILGIKGFIDSLFYKREFTEYIQSNDFRQFIRDEDFNVILIYTLIFLCLFNFTIQMTRKIGYSTLINLILGRYRQPREEIRIFMFVDLISSTTIAEELGNLKYHALLNEIYFDITRCIMATRGEIYRYVGDEIDISWKYKNGIRNANCLSAYFYILSEIKQNTDKYLSKYEVKPEFRVSYHSGRVLTGELGTIKSQIVFFGETIRIISHLKSECKRLKKQIIITADLMKEIRLIPDYKSIQCGELDLGPVSRKVPLYTIQEISSGS